MEREIVVSALPTLCANLSLALWIPAMLISEEAEGAQRLFVAAHVVAAIANNRYVNAAMGPFFGALFYKKICGAIQTHIFNNVLTFVVLFVLLALITGTMEKVFGFLAGRDYIKVPMTADDLGRRPSRKTYIEVGVSLALNMISSSLLYALLFADMPPYVTFLWIQITVLIPVINSACAFSALSVCGRAYLSTSVFLFVFSMLYIALFVLPQKELFEVYRMNFKSNSSIYRMAAEALSHINKL